MAKNHTTTRKLSPWVIIIINKNWNHTKTTTTKTKWGLYCESGQACAHEDGSLSFTTLIQISAASQPANQQTQQSK